jgi:hypothetical protein
MSKSTHFQTSAGLRLGPLALAATLVVASLLAPAAANAATFGVTAGDSASLQSALKQAAAHANSGGPDVVSVPAGTFVGTFSYTGDPVEVEGAGRATTKLTSTGANSTTFFLDAPDSTVSGLSIENTQAGSVGYGLSLDQGGTVRDVELVATGNNVFGLFSVADSAITDTRVVVGGADDSGLRQGSGTMTISRTTIEGSGGSSSGLDASGPAAIHASRLRIRGVRAPLAAVFGGSLTVRDSLLVLPTGAPATALEASDHNNATNFTSTLVADRVTIVGDPTAKQTGARVFANSAGDDYEISIHDSILHGIARPLDCSSTAGKGSTAADWSSLPGSGDSSGGAGCTVTRTNAVAGAPIFVDAPGGDYRQRYDSPVIDAGDPAPMTTIDDLDGLSRPFGRGDLGPYEYQRRSPLVSVSASADATTGQDVTFVATASDPDPGDSPLSYAWSFDDGATATGPTAAHAFATDGPHTGTVTVKDPTGLSASASSTVMIAPPASPSPAPGGTSDRTPPTITLSVKPRQSLVKTLRRGVAATIACSEACAYRTTVLLEARTAKRLHLARRITRGRRTADLSAAGRRTISVKLTRRARAALGGLAGVKLLVRASATDRAGNASPTRARRTMLRR